MNKVTKPQNRPTLQRGTKPEGRPSVSSGRKIGGMGKKKGGCSSCK